MQSGMLVVLCERVIFDLMLGMLNDSSNMKKLSKNLSILACFFFTRNSKGIQLTKKSNGGGEKVHINAYVGEILDIQKKLPYC